MTPSKALFYLCVSFLTGILIGSAIKISRLFLWGILFLAIFLIIFQLFLSLKKKEFQKNYFLIMGFCILFLSLGILRVEVAQLYVFNNELRKLNDRGEIALAGRIVTEPDVRLNSQKLRVKIDNPEGIVLVTAGRYPEYKYMDILKIEGKLKTPIETEYFNYKNYLLKDGIYSVMDFPKIDLVSQKHNIFSFFYGKILLFKEKLREVINANYNPPESFILEGIVLGNDRAMARDLKDKLNYTGLSHVTAVSGSHVVILSSILMSFLLFLGLWRGQAFYFSLVLIWLYIVLVGFPASGVRAAIMGSIFLLGQKLGRQNTSSRTITLAAALMLLSNPFLLFYDIGFQLSFMASLGIIYLKPIIDNLFLVLSKEELFGLIRGDFKNLLDIISVTIAVQIFTLPIIIYNFGNISLVAPITNLLALPVVPPLMTLGFLSSILGIFSQFATQIIVLPCWILAYYFVKVVEIFYQPWVIINLQKFSWVWLLAFYLVLGAFVYYINKRRKMKILGY